MGPAGIPFVQAPHLLSGIPLDHRAAGYSDILLSQGWADCEALSGLVQGWLSLFKLWRPDILVLDYAPTASLAGRIARLPTVSVGNGFELPPLTDPLPPFPGFSWATVDVAARSERRAVGNANKLLRAAKASTVAALRDILGEGPRLFATFPVLDHYGERADGWYIGPLRGALSNTTRLDWPEGEGPRVFASLRPDTSRVHAILSALASIRARVVCVSPDFREAEIAHHRGPHIRFAARPVDLPALGKADLSVTYGAEGTGMHFLLAGVPQIISPWHVEAYMGARRIQAAGFGITLEGSHTATSVADCIVRACTDPTICTNTETFGARARDDLTTRCPTVAVIETLRGTLSVSGNDALTAFAKERVA
jgi:UDP:flavonoid glycosyltransferase YjiC (YdhE family)